MRLTLLRHSVGGLRAVTLCLALLGGLGIAASATWLVLGDAAPARAGIDGLALVFALWSLGWLIGPLFLGGSAGTLVPAHFASLPLRPNRLSVGLFAASLVGVGPLVTLAVFSVAGVLGARMGFEAFLIAIPAVALQFVFVVIASRVVTDAFGAAITSTVRAIISALPWAIVGALAAQSWLLLPSLAQADGLQSTFARALLWLPSGWSLLAIQTASSGQWSVAFAALGALLGGCIGLFATSSWLTRRRVAQPATNIRAERRRWLSSSRAWKPRGPVSAVVGKEQRTMARDLDRALLLSFAIFFALAVTTVPLLVGETLYLAGGGIILALLATIGGAQLYAGDGTALWTTLMIPRAEQTDVRGRQLAWLLVVAPLAILATIIGGLVAMQSWTWPWALSLLPAALGAGAGLIVLTSVYALVPMPDPRRRARDAAGGDGTLGLIAWAMLPLAILVTSPAAVLPLLGSLLGSPTIQWLGVPVGLALGIVAATVLGRLASKRLQSAGPELLQRMRTTRAPGDPIGWVSNRVDRASRRRHPAEVTGEVPMPLSAAVTSWALYLVGFAVIVTQCVVPAILRVTNADTPAWFVALHLPEPAQIPALFAIGLVGLAGILIATWVAHRFSRAARGHFRLP